MIEPRPDWWDAATCTTLDPNLFFPTQGGDVTAPKAVCAGCPVRDTCLDHALDRRELFGIWGGTSERERRRMRRRRAA